MRKKGTERRACLSCLPLPGPPLALAVEAATESRGNALLSLSVFLSPIAHAFGRLRNCLPVCACVHDSGVASLGRGKELEADRIGGGGGDVVDVTWIIA